MEKLAHLVEGIDFESIEQYAEKVQNHKESYFGKGSTRILSTQMIHTDTPSILNFKYYKYSAYGKLCKCYQSSTQINKH
jgi:hypothetical protein